VCNHYRNSVRKGEDPPQWYVLDEFSETRIELDTLPRDVYPDRDAAVIRLNGNGAPSLDVMRWGFPPVQRTVVTNVRNTTSNFWKPWLKTEYRCLVPATSFAEWSPGPPKGERWFATPDGSPFCFAGIWRPWTGTRGTKSNPVEGEHKLFAFLTCPPNDVVKPIHPKAMPVILKPEDHDQWLTGSVEEALELQRPFPNDDLILETAA